MKSNSRKPKKRAAKKKVTENPNWQPTNNPVKIHEGKTSTAVLMEMRAEESY